MGRDVALMEDVEQWTGYLAEARDKGQAIIAQEFIGSAPGRDVRFFFADFEAGPNTAGDGPGTAAGSSSVAAGTGSTPGWICVMRSSPGFLSNAHAGGTMTRFMPPVALQREAERIFSASGLVYGTVDFLFADGSGTEFVVCELNANPGFEELERATGVDAAAAIIKSVRNHADAGTTMHAVLPETPTPGKDGTA
jgi:glutathione synthase/RimK-type ligase-like ATP-grasp enzyme